MQDGTAGGIGKGAFGRKLNVRGKNKVELMCLWVFACVGRFYVFIVLHVCASTNGCRVVRVSVYVFVYSRRIRDER